MKIVKREIQALITGYKDLTLEDIILFGMAQKVRQNAQAPYSHFLVGSAVMSVSGKIYVGCNVERASWTQTTHAEQNAIDNMVANEGATKIKRIAIIGGADCVNTTFPPKEILKQDISFSDIPVPCGHCLQIIWENCHEDKTIELLSLCGNGQIARIMIDSAFPLKFGPKNLGVSY